MLILWLDVPEGSATAPEPLPFGHKGCSGDDEVEAIFRSTPAGLISVDRELRIHRASALMAEIDGFALDDYIGRNLVEVITPALADQLIPLYHHVLYTGETVRQEIAIPRLSEGDGKGYWLCTYGPVTNYQGACVGVIGFIVDITRLKLAETQAAAQSEVLATQVHQLKQLSETLEYHNELLVMAEELANAGHWQIDLPSRTLYWSDEIFRIHGLPVGKTPSLEEAIDFYHPDDRAQIKSLIQTAIATGHRRTGRVPPLTH